MQLDPANLLDELEEHMMKTEEALVNSFHTIRTGKASPSLVENIMVEYYGTPTRRSSPASTRRNRGCS